MSPLTVELASVARSINGIGCAWTRGITLSVNNLLYLDAHVYGAFNLAYGIGTIGVFASILSS